MVQDLPRPSYDTSKASSNGDSPTEKENSEWLDKKFSINRDISISGDLPSTETLKAGTVRVFRDPATGRITIYANSGGQIVDLLQLEV